MSKLVLNAGSANNDKTGDTLRAGALKIKANFDEIYAALASDGMNISGGNVLKTGDYQDLRNKPSFAVVATSGDFYDLSARPDIGIFVGAPGNDEGSDGHVAGNLAFDGNNLYVCREDYIQQQQFTGFEFLHDENLVDFSLQARFSNTGAEIALNVDITKPAPSVDWQVTDGTTTRTITMVSEELDGDVTYYLCTLDGAFTSMAGTYYEVGFEVPAGQYVFCATWNADYQDLLDAHDSGQGSKLYVTYDGYGRVITQIIHDSIENEITIAYAAGSQIADYDGIIVKLDQPKIWKSVPWATTYGSGGSGDTGNVTFSNTTITGLSNSLTFKADSTADYGLELFNSIDNDTHLRPLTRDKGVAIGFGYGMGSHIRVEGTNGQGGVPNSGDRVGIFAMDTDTGNSAEWIFDNDGVLTLPADGDILNADGYSVIKSLPQNQQSSSNNYTLTLSDAGKHILKDEGGGYGVEVPTNASVAFPIGTVITIVSGDSWTYIYPVDFETTEVWGAGFNQASTGWYIPNNSMATLLKIGTDKWMLSGAGLAID